jgi:hypothetical protein
MQRVTVGSTTYDQGEGIYMPNDNAVGGWRYQDVERSVLTWVTSTSAM